MKQNTVTISLQEFDELRDFKRKIESGEPFVITTTELYSSRYSHETKKFYNHPENDFIRELKEQISMKDLSIKENERQIDHLHKVISENILRHKDELEKLSNMNWRQFKQWKKSNL